MAGLQGLFLTFVDVKTPLDAEEKLFKIKAADDGKMIIQSMPQSYPSQVWFWTDMTKIPLQFMQKKKEKKEGVKDAR